MHSARGCIQFEKTAKDADGASRGSTRRSSTEGSMFGEARMQLLNPKEQACTKSRHPHQHLKLMHLTHTQRHYISPALLTSSVPHRRMAARLLHVQ